ncbi:hypothetical protein DXG01_005096 [Tephrocybe rancida]|nr:hypothetical protein DXG01_005096 [Tephrocybe rancida]
MSESQAEEHEPLLRPSVMPFFGSSSPVAHFSHRFREDVDATPVYPIIHMIRTYFIDTPLTYDALMAPDITYTLIQPLVEKYLAIQHNGNASVVFCLLLNRVHFLRDDNILTATISQSRATLCEILAIRTFRDYGNSMLQLTRTLTTTWPVYNGADPHVLQQAREERDDDLEDRVGNAIEMAILGKSKRFIKSSSCQKVINAIWTHTKEHPFTSMTLTRLLSLITTAIEVSKRDRLDVPEVVFMVYSLGFTLEKVAAMQEHGIKVYFKGTWNGFDLAFVTIFVFYATLRLYGFYYNSLWARELGVDCLALIACLLFPRLAFVTLKDNLMVLSLRAMMAQFVVLMLIAAFCFCGFLYALWTLSHNGPRYSAGTIAWWMLDLWFGLDASGFDRATQFHPIFGPFLMVTYACLSNTLLLTVLVSILSNTFAKINEDAAAEAMFRKAVSTIEGVKADSLFSYQPPINLFALCIMLPANYLLTPRWFHKVNVFMIRVTSFPILLLISVYERQSKKNGTVNFYETVSAVAEKIFEIEEEFESALDTNDDASYQVNQVSERPRRRSSQTAGAQPAPMARTRLYSIMHRGNEAAQSFVSPLAQVFQPLVVDEAIPEEPMDKAESSLVSRKATSPVPVPAAVSYGPASRRRMSSMPGLRSQQQPSSPPLLHQLQTRKFPMLSKSSSPPAGTFMRSPDRITEAEPPSSPETASRAMEESQANHAMGGVAIERRLEEMEKRQERIEELLMQIAKDVKH